jgi:hypothetical protein
MAFRFDGRACAPPGPGGTAVLVPPDKKQRAAVPVAAVGFGSQAEGNA